MAQKMTWQKEELHKGHIAIWGEGRHCEEADMCEAKVQIKEIAFMYDVYEHPERGHSENRS